MKIPALTVLGIVLLALGVTLLFRSFSREKVVDLGSVEITREREDSAPLPLIGGAALIVGATLFWVGTRKGS